MKKTYRREFSAFSNISQLDKKIIITNDEIDYSTSNVQHIQFRFNIYMIIESDILELDREECFIRAKELFLEESGCGREGEKYNRMRKEAFEIRKLIEPRIEIKALYTFYDEIKLDGQTLTVNDHEFTCTAFEQIDPESVGGVYFYAITAGDYYLENRPIMQQLYADIWGTAFVDASRRMLIKSLNERSKISDSFGPGFYGMDVAEMKKMPELVDFHKLGMVVKESCVILPLKSCAGMLFKVNEKYKTLNGSCELCHGSKKTCSLCSVRNHVI